MDENLKRALYGTGLTGVSATFSFGAGLCVLTPIFTGDSKSDHVNINFEKMENTLEGFLTEKIELSPENLNSLSNNLYQLEDSVVYHDNDEERVRGFANEIRALSKTYDGKIEERQTVLTTILRIQDDLPYLHSNSQTRITQVDTLFWGAFLAFGVLSLAAGRLSIKEYSKAIKNYFLKPKTS